MANFLKIAQLLGGFSSKNQAKKAAEMLTKRGTAKEYNPKEVFTNTNPEYTASIFSNKPRQSAYERIEPFGVNYTPAEGRDIALRQLTQDKIYNNRLMKGQSSLAPMFKSYGRTNLGLGFGAGVTPSLLALYLLSQQEENKK